MHCSSCFVIFRFFIFDIFLIFSVFSFCFHFSFFSFFSFFQCFHFSVFSSFSIFLLLILTYFLGMCARLFVWMFVQTQKHWQSDQKNPKKGGRAGVNKNTLGSHQPKAMTAAHTLPKLKIQTHFTLDWAVLRSFIPLAQFVKRELSKQFTGHA